MLVLKFINKTKTKLLRTYAAREKDIGKFVDCTDLRRPIQEHLSKNPVSLNGLHTDNLYLKNQLKQLTLSDRPVNCSETVEFFLKVIE
jgi:hypothetical protein